MANASSGQGVCKPVASSPAVRRNMQANGGESELERRLRSALHQRGLRFRKNALVMNGVRVRPDIVFTRARVAVFVDGCFWHRCPVHGSEPRANREWWARKFEENVERDRVHDAVLKDAGWLVLRVWEHEALSDMVGRVVSVLACRVPSDVDG